MDDSAFGPSPTLPARFGRYHIVANIPGGNMGRLYLAQDPDIDRMVVVKALDGDRTQEEKHRFLREARAAGRLSHTNVVSIFDVGEHERTPFIVMEYIDGDTLAHRLKKRVPMLVSRRIEILDQLAAGLAYAHDQGVVHRDIKPSNLMIDKAEVLRILDFGIARLDSGEHTQTSSGIIGTLNYMSPEQWEGGVIDQRSDIFSVGAVAYEMFAYTRAFPGNSPPEVLRAVYGDGPPPLEDVADGTPAELSAIVHRMMSRLPEDRYPSLHVVRAALAGLKATTRTAEEEMLGQTVHMDRTPGQLAPGTSVPRSATSIEKTTLIVRDLTGPKRTQTAAPRTGTQTRAFAPAGAEDVTRTASGLDPTPPTQTVPPPPAHAGRGLALAGIAVAVAAIAVAGLVAWKVLGSGTTPPSTNPGDDPLTAATSQPVPTGASNSRGASPSPPTPSRGTQGSDATPTPNPPPDTSRGGRTSRDVDAGRSPSAATPAATKVSHVSVSGPYAFELRQAGKVVSESARRHDVDIDLNAGPVIASSSEYFLSLTVSGRGARVEIPPLGHLIVNTSPATRDACRLMIDGQDAGSPLQSAPGLTMASGSHHIGLKCGGALIDVKSRDITPGEERTIITLTRSFPESY